MRGYLVYGVRIDPRIIAVDSDAIYKGFTPWLTHVPLKLWCDDVFLEHILLKDSVQVCRS